jgi:hypothetical protein
MMVIAFDVVKSELHMHGACMGMIHTLHLFICFSEQCACCKDSYYLYLRIVKTKVDSVASGLITLAEEPHFDKT